MTLRVWQWLLFAVLFSLLPIAAYALVMVNRGVIQRISDIWCNGELVLIGATLIATASGYLFSATVEVPFYKEAVGALSVVLIVLGIVWWVDVTANILTPGATNAEWPLRYASPWYFGCTLISSVACVMLSKESEA